MVRLLRAAARSVSVTCSNFAADCRCDLLVITSSSSMAAERKEYKSVCGSSVLETQLTLELHIAQVQDGCDCAPDSLHLIRLEAESLEGIAGALVVRLLGEDVHATLVQIVILGHLLVQIILSQLVVAGTAQQLQEEEKESISSCSTHDNTL